MERERRASVATFYAPGAWRESVMLSVDAAHHARVRRLAVGDVVRLTSGDGRRAFGTIDSLGKSECIVRVDEASLELVPRPASIELLVPIGDRDRMLLLAEKAVELGVSTWCPVLYARSRSVNPRGEGESFEAKVLARQVGALEQSGSAWLPERKSAQLFDSVLETKGTRLLLDADGEALARVAETIEFPVTVALGPEGGLEEAERAEFIRAGWRPASLGGNVLRFETAAIAALAILRSRGG